MQYSIVFKALCWTVCFWIFTIILWARWDKWYSHFIDEDTEGQDVKGTGLLHTTVRRGRTRVSAHMFLFSVQSASCAPHTSWSILGEHMPLGNFLRNTSKPRQVFKDINVIIFGKDIIFKNFIFHLKLNIWDYCYCYYFTLRYYIYF